MHEGQRRAFERIVRGDPDLMRLLAGARNESLPQWRLGGGCLYQTVWNTLTGRPPRTGIKDYDLVYFDASDLSWEAEDRVIRHFAAAMRGFLGRLELRNQARVHLWFEQRFGMPYPPLSCTDDAFERYVSVVHAVGVRLEDDGRLDILAPFGLDDLFSMTIRPNRALPNSGSHAAKAARAKAIWPEVTVIPWNEDPAAGPCTPAGECL